MCGIAGIISLNPEEIHHHRLEQMGQSLVHRGPDGHGYWINSSGTAGFAHRRLAIIDLSDSANQPMHFKQFSIVYNGEIYNYPELRNELISKGYVFKTQSDTEVILAAYHCYRENCLELFDGMFAFAIWDDEKKELFAARDRFGEKPFFYHYNKKENCLFFASEIKALSAVGVAGEEDNQVLLYYLNTGFSRPAHHRGRTFFKSVLSLPPAHYLRYALHENKPEKKKYWELSKKTQPISEAVAMEEFKNLLRTAIQRRLRSDVPTATNLSGGLDSSSIAAVIKQLIPDGELYKSFSVVFPGFEKDESAYINEVTQRLSLENHSITATAESLADNLRDVCYYQEEPFNSSSVFIQFLLGGLAKSHGIKVLLDGQGADETLGGYSNYIHWYLQELLAHAKWGTFRKEKAFLAENKVPVEWGFKNYVAAFAAGSTAKALLAKQKALFKNNIELNEEFVAANYSEDLFYKPVVKGLNDVLLYNTTQAGLEELLRFADRNSMAHGVELRLPFLYHKLVEFVFSLPSHYKIRNGYTKWILRETMKEELPASVAWRKDKIGFEPPQLQWMKETPLQQLIYQSRQKLAAAGIIKKQVVNQPVRPSSAYAAESHDWRYLIAGMFI